jgi:signal transduction histidine kinase
MLFDVVLALGFTAAAVAVHQAHIDGVDANRASDLLSTLLTLLAVAPLAVRRLQPLPVLVACAVGLLGLMIGQYVVAVAPVGVLVAFYSAVAYGSARAVRIALCVVAALLVATFVVRPVDLSVEGMVVNGALLGAGWVLGTGVRERRALHDAQVAAARREVEFERERADRAAAEERLRISRELHDVLGHAMSVMVVQAGVAQHLLSTRPDQAAEALARITETGRSSLEELRRLLTVIREGGEQVSSSGPMGLDALPALAAEMRAAGLPVELSCHVAGDLPAGVELAAYRIVQEALTNALRHAGPATATVQVAHDGTELFVEVSDDGRGGAAEPTAHPGRGLAGMRERVAVYGGELATGTGNDGGYRVQARIPVQFSTAELTAAPTVPRAR